MIVCRPHIYPVNESEASETPKMSLQAHGHRNDIHVPGPGQWKRNATIDQALRHWTSSGDPKAAPYRRAQFKNIAEKSA